MSPARERQTSVSTARPARTVGKLDLDAATVRQARSLARAAGRPIVRLAKTHTTVSVERAVLRLAGLAGADAEGIPWVNRLTDAVRDQAGLEHGVALPVWDALRRSGDGDLTALAQRAAAGGVELRVPDGRDAERARTASARAVGRGIATIDRRRAERDRMVARIGDAPRQPWIYLIVATGDIYEDIPQAQAAAREGADVIAVIRSTGQSLLDYVPEGATREGYAGTYATQENFRLMRAALDEVSKELGPLRPADQLRVRAVHARDRRAGRARAAGHDAQRLDVRDPLPRHQPGPDLRRPAVLPAGARPGRDHHQHRRGQLPHHRRRGRRGAHRHRVPAAQRVLRQGGRAPGLAARAGARVRDQPGRAGLVPARAGPRAARPRAVPQGAAEVDAPHQAHDRRRVPRLPAGRLLQPRRRSDRAGHPAGRHDDRGGRHAVPVRPRPGAAERPLRPGRRRQPARGLPPAARRLHPDAGPTRCSTRRSSCWSGSPTSRGRRRCSRRSATARSG